MVKKMFLFFIACAFAQAQQKTATQAAHAEKPASEDKPAQAQKQALSWCRLGADPVDVSRKPHWDSECIVKISVSTPVVMTTGSGRRVHCLLPPFTPIVVDRVTGAAKWVLACGNPLLEPANWVPSGTRICGPEPLQAIAPAPAPALSQTQSAPPAEVRVTGEIRHVHEGAVRLVHEVPAITPPPAPEPTPAPIPQPRKGWWARNWKIIVPVAIGAGAGAAVALTRGGGVKTIQYQPLPPPLYRP